MLATVTVDGVTVTSGSPSGAIALNLGANTMTVVVTGGDGTTTKTYTITINRGASGSPENSTKLRSLQKSGTKTGSLIAGSAYSGMIGDAISGSMGNTGGAPLPSTERRPFGRIQPRHGRAP